MSNPWNLWREAEHNTATPLRIHLFVSRTKDNRDVQDFVQRRRARIAFDSDIACVEQQFDEFVNKGVYGEFCRWYSSVNARDPEAVRRGLIHKLVDGCDISRLEGTCVSIAAHKECAAERQWMFDFDDDSPISKAMFINNLCDEGAFDMNEIKTYQTPHGYAIICPHGFDTRELMRTWSDTVDLKRDDMLCRDWKTKS